MENNSSNSLFWKTYLFILTKYLSSCLIWRKKLNICPVDYFEEQNICPIVYFGKIFGQLFILEEYLSSCLFWFLPSLRLMAWDCPGHCSKLAPSLMDYQYLFFSIFLVICIFMWIWWIINIFSFNFSFNLFA